MQKSLATPLHLGNLTLKNRIVMSALTRNRCPGTIPTSLTAEYYSQRSSAGLIITEGILVENQGSEWSHVSGLWTEEQVLGWKNVTDSVHAKGGLIFAQLWHIGRCAHPLLQGGRPNVSASAIQAKGGKFRQLEGTPGYFKPIAIEDPWEYVEKFHQAAKNAKKAGFDGVEIHCATGYLPAQFLENHSNQRTDEWGGSPQARAKFATEITKAAVSVFGSKHVGVKVSPCGGKNDMGDPMDQLLSNYGALIKNLNELDIGYITLTRYVPAPDYEGRGTPFDVVEKFSGLISNPLVFGNGGFSGEEANKLIEEGLLDAVCFGRKFITNPDLADRLLNDLELNLEFDFPTFYNSKDGDLGTGYTSYPQYNK